MRYVVDTTSDNMSATHPEAGEATWPTPQGGLKITVAKCAPPPWTAATPSNCFAVTGQLGMAAAGRIRRAVVNPARQVAQPAGVRIPEVLTR